MSLSAYLQYSLCCSCRLAAIFLASKAENEFIVVQDLLKVFQKENLLREVIDFEMLLLQVHSSWH